MGEYNLDMAAVRMEDYLNENGTARTLFGKIEEDQTNPMLSFFTEGRFAKDSPELQELAKKDQSYTSKLLVRMKAYLLQELEMK